MKSKLLIILFLTGSIIPNLLFSQFTQQGPKLIGANFLGQGNQGSSVSISSDGNTAIIGGYGDNSNIGAIWVFTRSGGVWTQQGPKLVGTGLIGASGQGSSAALSSDGNTIFECGYEDNTYIGAAWVFTRSGGVWTQQGDKLLGNGEIGMGYFGWSCSISSDGNTAVVGAFRDNGFTGAIWIFTRNGGAWTQQGSKLIGTGGFSYSKQGYSVAISGDGNTVAEGGQWDNNYLGAIWIFTRNGGVWTQQGPKLAGTGAFGSQVYQGSSVALSSDGNTVIEGGYADDNFGGSVWAFTRSNGVWTQQGPKFNGTGGTGTTGQEQGNSIAISQDGNTAVVGGYADGSDSGAVWVFTRSGGVWSQLGSKLVGTGSNGQEIFQGSSVSISSNGTLIEGALGDGGHVGAAWVFVYPGIGITPISSEVPKNFSLSQNYPNPFNPATKIKFDLPEGNGDDRFVLLKIYDVLGREVSTLVNQQLQPGTYEVNFDAANFESGVYFYKLTSGDFVETKKMILLK